MQRTDQTSEEQKHTQQNEQQAHKTSLQLSVMVESYAPNLLCLAARGLRRVGRSAMRVAESFGMFHVP